MFLSQKYIYGKGNHWQHHLLINLKYVVNWVAQPALVFDSKFGFSIQTSEGIYNFSIPTAFHDFIE